jgi:hypothetical protein
MFASFRLLFIFLGVLALVAEKRVTAYGDEWTGKNIPFIFSLSQIVVIQ